MLVLISDARFLKFFFPLKTEVHLGGSLSGHQLLQMSCWLLVTALYVVFNSNVSQLLFRFLCYHQLNRSLGLSREKQMEASFRKRNSHAENPPYPDDSVNIPSFLPLHCFFTSLVGARYTAM